MAFGWGPHVFVSFLLDHLAYTRIGPFKILENIGFKSTGDICKIFNSLKEGASQIPSME